MAFYRCGGGGIPSSLKTDMNAVLNKKFGTSSDYPPADWAPTVNLMGPLPIIISNKAPIVSFNDGADDVPVELGTFYIVPSGGGGTPSAPVAISGYTGMTIMHTDGQTPPVESETLAVSWQTEADIVYGGNLNVTAGVLTVNYIRLDLSSSSYWNMNNDTQFRLRWANYLSANGWNGSWNNIKSNVFECVNPSTAFSNMPDYSFRNVSQNYYNFEVKVPTGLFANASAFMSWLANVDGNGTHAYICIERNPSDVQTYQLTEHELRTFLGANNFYCDTGDSQLNYRADINLALGGQ